MQNLATALAGFHADVGPIHKTSAAQYGKYADLATVLSTIAPTLSKHGLSIVQTFSPLEIGSSTVLLRTTLLHSSGETVSSDLPMPSTDGQRNALHAFGAATTYLRRYALLAMLNLAAEDDDGDSFGAEPKAVSKAGTGTQRQPAARPAPDGNLSAAEKKQLLTSVQAIGPDRVSLLASAFRDQFSLPSDVPVSDYIKTKDHQAFIHSWINSNPTGNGTKAAAVVA